MKRIQINKNFFDLHLAGQSIGLKKTSMLADVHLGKWLILGKMVCGSRKAEGAFYKKILSFLMSLK